MRSAVHSRDSLGQARRTSIRNYLLQCFCVCELLPLWISPRCEHESWQIIVFVFSWRKKSVDDLLTSSQDVLNQAISLTTNSSPGKARSSPSPSIKKSHKRDRSDVSNLSSDYVEVVSHKVQSIRCACSPVIKSPCGLHPEQLGTRDINSDSMNTPNMLLFLTLHLV